VACTRIALNLRHGKTRNLIAVALDDGHVKFDDISGHDHAEVLNPFHAPRPGLLAERLTGQRRAAMINMRSSINAPG
jgi:hypothetical protein